MTFLLPSAQTFDYLHSFAVSHGGSSAVHDYPPNNNCSTNATTRNASSLIRSWRGYEDGRWDFEYMREIHAKWRKRMNDVER